MTPYTIAEFVELPPDEQQDYMDNLGDDELEDLVETSTQYANGEISGDTPC